MASWFGGFDQISISTDDLDQSISFWERRMGVGPWTVFRGLMLSMRYETRQIMLPCHVALAWHDGRLVELIEVTGSGPSPFHDALNRPIIGLQRLAALSDNIGHDARSAEARGMECFAEGVTAGQRFIYFRSADAPGMIFELLERTPSCDALIERLRTRAENFLACAEPGPPVPPSDAGVITGTMTAAELVGYGGPEQFRISTVAVPQPGPGEVLIRVAGAAVNPVDLKARKGLLRDYVPLSFPARLGGDVSGVVEALGPGVRQFAVGDRVAGMINPFADGAYAACVVAPEASLARVPVEIALADACAAPTGILTGTQLIEHGVRPAPGARVLVAGAAGSTGRAAVMAALDAGARVYAGVRPGSRDTIADLEVAGVVDPADDAQLKSAGPFDAVADTIGGPAGEKLFQYVRRDGVVASIAMPPPEPPVGSTQRFCSLTVTFDRARLEQFFREWAAGRRSVPIAQRYSLAEVAKAHQQMEQGAVGGKIILVPD